MINDLLTDLTISTLDRLLSPETSREEADMGLARIDARLSPRARGENLMLDPASPPVFDPELEPRLLKHYLELRVDDLEQVSPRVHEWLLERMSQTSPKLDERAVATLRAIYFLFPEGTVRHAVVNYLVRADTQSAGIEPPLDKPPVATIWEAIDDDQAMSSEDRIVQMRLLADILLDYVDLFPDPIERAVAALYQTHQEKTLNEYLNDWANRLGGESGSLIRRAIERQNRR